MTFHGRSISASNHGLKRFLLALAVAAVAAAMYVAAASGSRSAAAHHHAAPPTGKQFAALKKSVAKIGKKVKTQGATIKAQGATISSLNALVSTQATTITKLQSQLTALQTDETAVKTMATADDGFISTCLVAGGVAGVSEFGDPAGTFGYVFDNGGGSDVDVAALDLDSSATPDFLFQTVAPSCVSSSSSSSALRSGHAREALGSMPAAKHR